VTNRPQGQPDEGGRLHRLTLARKAREGRDQWRQVAPILRELRELGVSLTEIHLHTGISPATASRLMRQRRSLRSLMTPSSS
jgi:DNA invertase Pin-like site-specific DNA recombinase